MQVLTQAQLALGGLEGGVAEGELDLFKWGLTVVGELGEAAP